MKEFLQRLRAKPLIMAQLLGASFFVNLLSFASPLFVMLILGQYVDSGFDGTLITLSVGMLVALLMQIGFRQARTLMAGLLSIERDREIAHALFEVLTRARTMALLRVPEGAKQEMTGHLQTVQTAFAPGTVCAMLDAPFSLLFIVATFFLSPALAWIGLVGMVVTVILGLTSMSANRKSVLEMQRASVAVRGVSSMALAGADTVRAYGAGDYLRKVWRGYMGALLDVRERLAGLKGRSIGANQTLAVLVRVCIYAWGAKQCVLGELSFAALIAANILVSRGIRQASLLVGAVSQLSRAEQALGFLREFFKLPLELQNGTALRSYSGRLELKDMAFAYPGGTGPLFESLSLSLVPGSVTVIHGANGTGKTTMARLLTGLLDPMRGEVLADGITIRQLAPAWWRKQLVYVPQEPEFLAGTIRENILMANPEATEDSVDRAVSRAGLARWLGASALGLETSMTELGRNLPLGVRRRIAMARALITDGQLAIFDEPLEGLDSEGAKAAHELIRSLAEQGCTVIVLSHDLAVVDSPHFAVDLNVKPVPTIMRLAPLPGTAAMEKNHA
ncbi:ATP-binding cassette domain-containing protein [Desulfovibrio ferrophilus]|uniref:Peptide-transporting ATPase n=1 Tax=Desulfovibrio ferrophilus TaxID=241368 RepID=A0A2Z6AUV6_9BACT|nr:ATP-binding cassette domain-containing protein [Desulfovibrio ferrophilus]BBD07013.1 peptide-transporting ATPase [Desulfovibrio ferrophilus]